MTLDRAGRLLKHRGGLARFFLWPWAIRSLVAAADVPSVELLAQTLKHTDAYWHDRVCTELVRIVRSNQQAADALWGLWAKERLTSWGIILCQARVICEDSELRDLGMLKLGLANEMPVDRNFALDLTRYADDQDSDVRHAYRAYVSWLRTIDRRLFQRVCLQTGDYVRLGCSRVVVDELLSGEDDELQALLDGYRKQLPLRLAVYWDLRTDEIARVRLQPPTPWEILPYLKDDDEQIRDRAMAIVDELNGTQPELWTLIKLKLGETEELKQHPAAVRQVLGWLDHTDKDVSTSATTYIEALPQDDATNEVLFAEWVRRDSNPVLANLLVNDRLPPGPGMRTLYFLLTATFDAYLALDDNDGELFLEAWLIASEAQRERLNQIIGDSGNEAVIQAYQRALSRREDYDLQLHIDALTAAGLDERLFDLLPDMSFRQALAAVVRWSDNGWRPEEEADCALIDQAVRDCDERSRISWRPSSAPLPEGTSDLFDYLRSGDYNEPPFARLKSALAGELDDAATSPHWLERYCARTVAADLDLTAPEDQVLWVNAASVNIPELMDARLSCGPEELERSRALLNAVDGVDGMLPERIRTMAGILLAFRRRLNTDIELMDDDHPTDAAAVEIELVEEASP